jgi:hypothetical protein
VNTVTIEADGRSATIDATVFAAITKSDPPFPGFTGFAPADTLEHVAHQLMSEHETHFGRLADVEARFAFRFGKRPDDLAERIPDMGKAVIVPPLILDLLGVALIVWVDRWAWDELEPRARVAFVAHLLSSVDVDQDGKLVKVRPDVNGFAWVAGRYGAWENGLRLLTNQLGLFASAEDEKATA